MAPSGVVAAVMLLLGACGDESKNADEVSAVDVESVGQITGTMNGDRHVWHITATKEGQVWRSQSDWSPLQSGAIIATVNMFGMSDPSRTMGSNGALVLGFSLATEGGSYSAINSEINLYPKKAGLGNYSSSNDGDVTIVVAQATQSGDLMRLKGNWNGRLPFKKFSSRDADMSDVVTIENGSFDVALPPLQK